MAAWTLIVILYTAGAVGTARFEMPTYAECRKAGEEITADVRRKTDLGAHFVCVERRGAGRVR